MEEDGTTRREPTLSYLDTDTYSRVRMGVKEKDIPKWIWDKVKEPSEAQRRRMVALSICTVARYTFENHLYKFNGQVYRQTSGGPIGDNATNDAANIVMWQFIIGYRKMLARLDLLSQSVLLKVYVDDLNQAGLRLPY